MLEEVCEDTDSFTVCKGKIVFSKLFEVGIYKEIKRFFSWSQETAC